MHKGKDLFMHTFNLIVSSQDSLTVISDALVEQTVKEAAVYDKFQFERIGFFSVDPDSSKQKVSDCLILTSIFSSLFSLYFLCYYTVGRNRLKLKTLMIGDHFLCSHDL